jgi:D-serine deaminase-like pyridoxal phosphate-dependent protein
MPWTAESRLAGSATPFLVVDGPKLLRNIQRMAEQTAATGGHLTPHLKTHKSSEIARHQLAAGAGRATVATVAEARMALAAGFDRLLLAYPPAPDWRADQFGELTAHADVVVSCFRSEHVDALVRSGRSFGVYWEVDTGTGRLGTPPGRPTAEAVHAARFTDRVTLRGLLSFAGNAYAAADEAGLADVARQQHAALSASTAALAELDIGAGLRSVGTTPLAAYERGRFDEYRYGNYVFNDASQVALGSAVLDDCALAVVASVVEVPSSCAVVLDCGSKCLPAEVMTGRTTGFGIVLGHPDLQLVKLFEEHGLGRSDAPHSLVVGERVAIVPNHACTCANLHDEYLVLDEQGDLVDRWAVRARRGYRGPSG